MPEAGSSATVPPGGRAGTATAPCSILHLDMDAFFAAVEVLDDPSLVGRPVIVGGSGPRGAVASCSYEARAWGVRSAMSSAEARRRCPTAVFRPGRHARYAEVSAQLGVLLRAVSPLVEPIGLDEAFLDVSGARRRLGPPEVIARQLRDRVQAELGLTCAVGVARTKSVAKLASRRAKAVAPAERRGGDGIVVILPEDEAGFLGPLPVGALWGVGPATATRLAGIGVTTVGALACVPEGVLRRLVGQAAAAHLAALASGRDTDPVRPGRPVRSIGRETTFPADLRDHRALSGWLAELATDVGHRLAARALVGRSVTVKVRFGDRRTITRSVTVDTPVDGPHQVLDAARPLVAQIDVGAGIRLLGVSVSHLVPVAERVQQLSLGGDAWGLAGTVPAERMAAAAADRTQGAGGLPAERGEQRGEAPGDRWRLVDSAVVALRERFGPGAVVPAIVIGTTPEEDTHRSDAR